MKNATIALLASLLIVAPAYASTFTPSAVCSNDPSTVLNWHADNASSTDQSFSWERLTGLETGSNTALANGGVDFSTGSSGTTSPDTLEFTFDDGTGPATVDVLANVTPCVPAPAPVVAPAPAPEPLVLAMGSSHRHDVTEETVVAPTRESIMLQIIDLLTQEIALVSAQQ